MKTLIFILIALFLSSCGSNNFAKRRYMKGVYVEKRTSIRSKKSIVKSDDLSQSKVEKIKDEVDKTTNHELINLDNSVGEEIDIKNDEYLLNRTYENSNENMVSERSNNLEIESMIESYVHKPEQTNHKVDLDNRPSNVYYWAQLSMYFGIGASSFSLISYIIGLIVVAFTATGIGGIIVSIIGILAGIAGFVLSIIALTKAKYMTKMEKFKASIGLILSIFAIVASIFALLGFISSTW